MRTEANQQRHRTGAARAGRVWVVIGAVVGAVRRVLKWAVLAAAIFVIACGGVYVAAASMGGERWAEFTWRLTLPEWVREIGGVGRTGRGSAFDLQTLNVWGWLGGFEVEWETWIERFVDPENPPYRSRWMWLPSFHRPTSGGWALCVPYWIPLLVPMAVVGGFFLRRRRARRRTLAGFCARCDYDRAGLATGAVCPECGKA